MIQKGLYQADYEHDACGVGMIVNIHGSKSHELVDNALKVLENMRHRGAEVGKDGDGAGILVQIPHEFILLQGIPVPERGKYGTGLVFLPKDQVAQKKILAVISDEVAREGLQLMPLRDVPVHADCLGEAARSTEPDIKQLFVTGVTDERLEAFPRSLYLIRKKIEKRVAALQAAATDEAMAKSYSQFYVCSLSNTSMIYKGMLSSMQVRQ